MVFQAMSSYIKLYQLVQVVHVMSGKVRLHVVRPGNFRLVKVRPV
jgi:hypothetical protein